MATALTKSKKDLMNPPKRSALATRVSARATAEFSTEITLSPRDSKQFLHHLNNPPKPNQKLKQAVARFKTMAR